MTDEAVRSPELLRLEEKYRKLREQQPVNAFEPRPAQAAPLLSPHQQLRRFVDLSTELAEQNTR